MMPLHELQKVQLQERLTLMTHDSTGFQMTSRIMCHERLTLMTHDSTSSEERFIVE